MRQETWGLKGRIAVRTDDESGSGTLYWTQRKDDYDIRVIASFSGGVYELSGADGVVSLLAPDQRVLQAEDAETLLRQAAPVHQGMEPALMAPYHHTWGHPPE